MKYIVDKHTNNTFIQIIGLSETGQNMEYPFAFQVRKDSASIESLKEALTETIQRIRKIDSTYHSDDKCKTEYELGFTIFKPGAIPVMIVCKQRTVSILFGHAQIGDGPLPNIDRLLKAL